MHQLIHSQALRCHDHPIWNVGANASFSNVDDLTFASTQLFHLIADYLQSWPEQAETALICFGPHTDFDELARVITVNFLTAQSDEPESIRKP